MNLTANIQKAINFAAEKHASQMRKADGLPYIVHPFSVAWILSNFTENEDVIIAGLLHDVLEDVKGYSLEEMRADFGDRVADIVKAVSEDKDPNVESDAKATWIDRKKKYLEHLKSAEIEALLVSVADKIHNLRSMRAAFEDQGNAVWAKFNSPPDKKMWFYEEVYRIASVRLGDHELVRCLQVELDGLRVVSGQ